MSSSPVSKDQGLTGFVELGATFRIVGNEYSGIEFGALNCKSEPLKSVQAMMGTLCGTQHINLEAPCSWTVAEGDYVNGMVA